MLLVNQTIWFYKNLLPYTVKSFLIILHQYSLRVDLYYQKPALDLVHSSALIEYF